MSDDLTANQILERVQDAAARGQYSEKLFKLSVCKVLEENGVEFETEYPIGPNHPDADPRRCDIYIPKTDTAIELKIQASMRGVGQCVYYTRYCKSALLLADGDPPENGHNRAVREAAEVATGVHYGLCIPGLRKRPPMMSIRTSDHCEFFHEGAYGDLGYSDFILIKDLGTSLRRYAGNYDDSGENSVNTQGRYERQKEDAWKRKDHGLNDFDRGGRRE